MTKSLIIKTIYYQKQWFYGRIYEFEIVLLQIIQGLVSYFGNSLKYWVDKV